MGYCSFKQQFLNSVVCADHLEYSGGIPTVDKVAETIKKECKGPVSYWVIARCIKNKTSAWS